MPTYNSAYTLTVRHNFLTSKQNKARSTGFVMQYPSAIDLSILGQFIQSLGIFSIALLFYMLNRAAPRTFFRYWVGAWFAMLFAMMALQAVFRFRPALDYLEFVYFFGEYLFAALLWAGFVSFPNRALPSWFSWRWVVSIAGCWSLLLTFLNLPFSGRFSIHAIFFAATLGPAWWVLRTLPISLEHKWVKQFCLVALTMLIVIFFVNGLPLSTSGWVDTYFMETYYAYQSIFDVLIEMLLAFSLITIAAVNLQSRLERTNTLLEAERDQMAMLAHKDALTNCFNRHALIELESRLLERDGLIVMIDINDLKIINDKYGHQTGDEVIIKVAQALKDCLRGNDYIFRYGGDEFLVVAFDFHINEGNERMREVEQYLSKVCIDSDTGYTVSISWGIQAFSPDTDLDYALGKADKAMYKQKNLNRAPDKA